MRLVAIAYVRSKIGATDLFLDHLTILGIERSKNGVYARELGHEEADSWVYGVHKKTMETRLSRWRKAFAAVMAQSRRDADLTQQEVANEMGWSRNTVTKIEGGSRPVTFEESVELCRLYKIDLQLAVGRALRW